eukprot:scaffold33786_cov124-Isochrysis_galbana.AAC.11
MGSQLGGEGVVRCPPTCSNVTNELCRRIAVKQSCPCPVASRARSRWRPGPRRRMREMCDVRQVVVSVRAVAVVSGGCASSFKLPGRCVRVRVRVAPIWSPRSRGRGRFVFVRGSGSRKRDQLKTIAGANAQWGHSGNLKEGNSPEGKGRL